jgi:hypothetical protein
MATVAVTTNAALLAFTSKLFSGDDATYGGVSRSYRVWIFLIFEHAVLILRFTLETMIPDVPEIVVIQAARTERLVDKVINLTPDDEADDGLSHSSSKVRSLELYYAHYSCSLILLPSFHTKM